MTTPHAHAQRGLAILRELWTEVSKSDDLDGADLDLADSVDAILDGEEVGYKKAIIIQVVGKAADFSLDAQALQKGSGRQGAWDAREFAKRVFVPWNAEIGSPLGNADDPYVSNQFRGPRLDGSIRAQRRSKSLFDKALSVLERANATTTQAELHDLLKQILLGVRRHLQGKSFEYPIPQRASLRDTEDCVAKFLDTSSGGARLQALVHALFAALSDTGMNYGDIVARHVNASDTAGGASGGVTFSSGSRSVAIEVKDRLLNAAQIAASVTKARVAEVTELIFVVHGPSSDRLFETDDDRSAAELIARKEFSSGLNLYWQPFLALARTILVLIGEDGRRSFLKSVGRSLEEQNVDARHRWVWTGIVAGI